MRRHVKICLTIMTLPMAAMAEEAMPLAEFDAYANGKTLYFSQDGAPYGIEQYLPGHRSIWQYQDGSCVRGIYYARREMICFIYEGDGQEQCWRFFKKGKDYSARAEGAVAEADLDVVGRDERAIPCKGPDVGV